MRRRRLDHEIDCEMLIPIALHFARQMIVQWLHARAMGEPSSTKLQ